MASPQVKNLSRADSKGSPGPRRSFVKVSSMADLSKVTKDQLEEQLPEEEASELFAQSFEEVPGAWSGGIGVDLDEIPSPIVFYTERSRCRFATAYVFALLTFIGTLFLAASLLNGGLPRYGVEQAEKITIFYNDSVRFLI